MKIAPPIVLCAALAGCVTSDETPVPAAMPAGAVINLGDIETDARGTCFARQAGPVETTVVTELVEVVPEVKDRNGVVTTPAIFRNVTRPQTVQTGPGPRFESVCPQLLTPDFVSTLQRALIVRRAYEGDITGDYDERTSLAVQQFQRDQGIDSPILAVGVARNLGLVAVARTDG